MIRIVRLGDARAPGEGTRIGTVRRPPRGVRKVDLARRDYYDVWVPVLAPSAALVGLGRTAASPREWAAFRRRYRAEMSRSDPAGVLELLSALSHVVNFSLGCYCAEESHCHRGVLRELLRERRAALQESPSQSE